MNFFHLLPYDLTSKQQPSHIDQPVALQWSGFQIWDKYLFIYCPTSPLAAPCYYKFLPLHNSQFDQQFWNAIPLNDSSKLCLQTLMVLRPNVLLSRQ